MINIDATFFALIALVLFLSVLLYAKTPGKAADLLDQRRNRITKELNDARTLREEAEALLAEYKQKRSDAVREAAAIIDQAKHEAESYAAETRTKLSETLIRRTKQAEMKIAQAQATAVKEVRAMAANTAIDAATRLISEASAKPSKLVDQSIAALKDRLN